jgi:hypothetical protein
MPVTHFSPLMRAFLAFAELSSALIRPMTAQVAAAFIPTY